MSLINRDILLGHIPLGSSLRVRLLKLAFLPLAVAFPLVVLVLALVGGALYDARLAAMLRSHLSTVRSHLAHQRSHTELFLSQQLKSGVLTQLLGDHVPAATLQEALAVQAAAIRLDFLCIADRHGRIIAANTGVRPGVSLAESYVLQQAITGVKSAGYEVMAPQLLADLAPALAARAEAGTAAPASPAGMAGSGLMLLVAAPFALSNDYADAVLCAGQLLNNDTFLIDALRAITFPLTPDNEQINGSVGLFLGDSSIAASLNGDQMQSVTGEQQGKIAWQVVAQGREYVHQLQVAGHPYLNASAPLIGAQGKAVGMMEVSIPATAYRNEQWLLIAGIASLLALSMFGSALVFQRGTRRIVQRLEQTIATVKAAKTDVQSTRIELTDTRDEITLLGAHFNELLDALMAGEAAQEQARQAMAAEAARRQDLFNRARDGLVLLDTEGCILEANPSFLQMLGSTEADLSNLRLRDWDLRYQQMDPGAVAEHLAKSALFDEVPYRRKDGSSYMAEVSCSQIQWNNERSFLLSIRDTTQIREMQRQLMQSQRLESLGEIAAGIAHEINSPMQFLLSNVTFMEEALTEIRAFLAKVQHSATMDEQALRAAVEELDVEYVQEEMPACLQEMHEGIDRVVKIVGAMKEFSHPGGSNKILTDINHLLDNTLIVCRNEWKYEAQVLTSFDPELPKTLCFPAQLNQVLLNLIINACHAIQSRKQAMPDHAGLISISTTTSEHGIEIQVRDNGGGIPEAILHRIYDPFFTTKTVGKGTGQGLAIARDIVVNKHGGLITCESTPDQGTLFTLTLPLLNE